MIPWSFSFLRDFANCPHKAMRKYIKRDLPKEDSPELREGIAVHETMERYINEDRPTMHADIHAFVEPLRLKGARAEVKLGMTQDWRPSEFFGEPWGRGKIDVLVLDPPAAFLVDWKTGKVREDKRELEQQALLVRANYPEISRITGCYVWLKEGRMGAIYDLTDVDRVYHATVAQMGQAQAYEDAGDWPKLSNPLCGHCPVKDCENNRNPNL